VRPALFEESDKDGLMFGWTNNYVRVAIPFNERLVNTIQDVELTTQTNDEHYLCTLSESVQQEEQAIAELIDG
jgi:threonylcarbamoyladenosine tRNA methylthiotransferase MtaB